MDEIGDPDPVYWALYHRHVHVDLSAAFLSHPDRVRVFVDQDAAAAWQAASESLAQEAAYIASPETIINAALAQFPPRRDDPGGARALRDPSTRDREREFPRTA